MSRRIDAVTQHNLSDLPIDCRTCVYWELPPSASRSLGGPGNDSAKQSWVADTLTQWGTCGHLAYVDDQLAGYVMYAPAAYVPRAAAFPTSPVSADAVLLMTARVAREHAGHGLGKLLVQTATREAVQRGIRALEAFGRNGPVAQSPSHSCLVPTGYLRAVGFTTVRAHPHTPRLRLDVRTAATWREDVGAALDRIFGRLQTPVTSRQRTESPV